MTMGKNIELGAGEFKARCLALLDQVAETGEEIVITKRGKPVAKLTPLEPPKSLEGSVRILSDILSPLDDEWEANQR